jgi:hypothetical protein
MTNQRDGGSGAGLTSRTGNVTDSKREPRGVVYPTERHTLEAEASRYDYNRRVGEFFGAHLRR